MIEQLSIVLTAAWDIYVECRVDLIVIIKTAAVVGSSGVVGAGRVS